MSSPRGTLPQFVVLDTGGQYCHLITRKIREQGVYCEIRPSEIDPAQLRGVKGIVISGGPASVYEAGCPIRAIDIHNCRLPSWLSFARDDIFSPDLSLYAGADVLYAIRPAEEMIPPLISLAQALNCDLVVYHLGFESYGDGGSIVDCGVPLHYYYLSKSGPVKKVLTD